jgi:adenosylmethionine-8-amino-7-oxononanoate aminotransferase
MQHFQEPIEIVRAQGLYLYDKNEKSYQDWISSWWVNLHGHAHAHIANAIYKQALQLEHVIFTRFTHAPAEHLAKKILERLPSRLNKIFYSDNGSTAVEIALKMAYQYFDNRGETRKLFLCLAEAYHGDTFGAMSAGNSHFHGLFRSFAFENRVIPVPYTFLGDEKVLEKENQALVVLDEILKKEGEQIAAFILEPLVQGAAGLRIYRPEFLAQVLERLKPYGILSIFDEVMTGFGRTGKFFAMDHLPDYSPDIVCLSKGITGGFLPLALTICQSYIYEAFLDKNFDKALAHGHSYTANPLACVAALACLELFEMEKTLEKIQMIADFHLQNSAKLTANKNIHHIRHLGTLLAFDYLESPGQFTFKNRRVLEEYFQQKGLFVRPIGNTFYLMPPYCVKTEELENVYAAFIEMPAEVF